MRKYESLQELTDYPLRDEVQLNDIAKVNYRLDPSATISRVDGKEGAPKGASFAKQELDKQIDQLKLIKESL